MEPAMRPLLAEDEEAGDTALQVSTPEPEEDSTDPTAIRTRTETCQALFEKCQQHFNSSEDDWIDKMSAAFNWWSLGIGAAKSGHSSLDRRVQTRDDVKRVIVSLLDSLKTSLENCIEIARAPVAEVASSDEAQKEQGDTSDLEEQMYYIRTTLQYLSRISASIRKSGTKFRHQRVDRLLEQRAPKLEEFRRYMAWIVLVGPTKMHLLNSLLQRHTLTGDIIWKKAWITLKAYFTDEKRLSPVQKRLIHANLVRRNRFDVYFRTFCEKVQGDKGKKAPETANEAAQHTTVPPRPASTTKPDSTAGLAIHHDTAPHTHSAPSQSGKSVERTVLSSQPATGIGSFVMPKRPPTQGTRSVSTKFSQGTMKQDYPKCPSSEGSAFWCPFCAQPLDASYSDRKKDKRWRGHVAEDLSPYVCIYEECQTPDVMYLSTDQWKAHLESPHSVARWICDTCWLDSEDPTEFEFDTEKDLTDHILAAHDGEFDEDDLEDLSEASRRSILPPVSCPLCHGESPLLHPGTDGHIAEHLHSFALQALPWETVGPDDDTHASLGSAIRRPSYPASNEESEGPGEGDDTMLEIHDPRQLLQSRFKYNKGYAKYLTTNDSLGSRFQNELSNISSSLRWYCERMTESTRDDLIDEANIRLENIALILDRFSINGKAEDLHATEDAEVDLREEMDGLSTLVQLADIASAKPPRAAREGSKEDSSVEIVGQTDKSHLGVLVVLTTGTFGIMGASALMERRNEGHRRRGEVIDSCPATNFAKLKEREHYYST